MEPSLGLGFRSPFLKNHFDDDFSFFSRLSELFLAKIPLCMICRWPKLALSFFFLLESISSFL